MAGAIKGDARKLDSLLGKTVKTTMKNSTAKTSQDVVRNIVKK